jgi:ERCC4-type nuclease
MEPQINKSKIKNKINKELETFKKDTVIIIDSRERKKDHITFFFDHNNINYKVQKLDTGDYSFIYLDNDYSNIFSVDRKQHVDELIGNLSEKRFVNELYRALKLKQFSFVVEHGHLGDIYKGNYRSIMKAKSAIALIETWKSRGIRFEFINGVGFGQYISTKIYYYLRNDLIEQEIKKQSSKQVII